MSAETRKRKARVLSPQPLTHVVVSLDAYMGDGEGSPDFGYAGINAVFGPFSEAEAEAFVVQREKLNEFATEYRVQKLSV